MQRRSAGVIRPGTITPTEETTACRLEGERDPEATRAFAAHLESLTERTAREERTDTMPPLGSHRSLVARI